MSAFHFDKRDYDLLHIVDDIRNRNNLPDHKRLLLPYLHPHGIKEMAAPRPLRIAYAVAHLIESLEVGEASDRLTALRSLRDEVFYSSQGSMRINTARVLLEIMKHLVRTKDDDLLRLMLAHDFNASATGTPRVVRKQLAEYHLLEMPEAWNQVTFDDHVHDAHSKGRKSPTHLIMDAWIKGIRRLTVIYYNFVPREAASELLDAAEIMGLEVRIGFECFTEFRAKPVRFICSPSDLSEWKAFDRFLSEPTVDAFMEEGRRTALEHQEHILELLRIYNERILPGICRKFGLVLPPLEPTDFLAFVGTAQASMNHLGKFLHGKILQSFTVRLAQIKTEYAKVSAEERNLVESLVNEMNGLSVEKILREHLRDAERFCGKPVAAKPTEPYALLCRLANLPYRFHITLNLCGLEAEDVLEVLYDCKGLITHLETVNLKNAVLGRNHDHAAILALQGAINSGSVIEFKKLLRAIVEKNKTTGDLERQDKLFHILYDLTTLQSYYRDKPLKSCVGSDSTGQSGQAHGMGFVLIDSMPPSAQKRIAEHERVPLRVVAFERHTMLSSERHGTLAGRFLKLCQIIPGLSMLGDSRSTDWKIREYLAADAMQSNIYTLGGSQAAENNGLSLEETTTPEDVKHIPVCYLKTNIKIALKIIFGFIPAFLTFTLTSDWWFLSYFGAILWFAITGLRNIIQSVLGCGGISRSSLISWNSLVSWNRLADSLLYSGISVPLLEYGVKIWFMGNVCGVTVATNPFLLYATISFVNGFYLLGHNLYRGLPKAAAYGNLFRSVLNIPFSMGLSALIGDALLFGGLPLNDVLDILQRWAAVLSKLASDGIAGIIEGLVDKGTYLRMRSLDYAGKMKQILETYTELEMVFPKDDVLLFMESSDKFMQTVKRKTRNLYDILIVNALDLMYFWMCQPRSREACRNLMSKMTLDERRLFLRLQEILSSEYDIGKLFVDGLVGKHFSKPLAFYLTYWNVYIKDISRYYEKLILRTTRRT
jgi:hypothetical protein